ncbi:MAG: Gfo/Idh/MocA family protein [Candidatus Hermodarchaeota archaeon]
MKDKKFLKVGVVGCGSITKIYKLSSKVIKNTKIVAAADLDINRAIKIGGKKHAYTDSNEMYNNEEFDAVYIATPHHLHKPMIKQAFENGKHILCEKPVSISLDDAREIQSLDKQYQNLKLGFNYNYRYDHNCYRLVKALQNNHLGEVYYANCSVLFSRSESYFEKGPWRTKRETAGGGTILIHGSHIFDIMIWVFGEPKAIMGKTDTVRFKNIDVEDFGLGIIEFENGVYAQINDSTFVKPPYGIIKDTVKLEVFGKNGRVIYKGPWPKSSLKWKGVKKFKTKKQIKGISHFGRSVKAFSEWVLHDKPYLNTVEESSKVLSLVSSLYKSSETNKKENIEKL